ncbi:hypothetical protein AABB24_020367 [Solanum stoloniferum]|uniref:Uncharacterized protein n=1 Tax=Solanum stoloniferum TaxID=62892 RepID=A0ABD2T7N4_9SOLN
MPKTQSMASLKSSGLLSSNSLDVLSLSSNSSDEYLASPSLSSKCKATATKKKGQKKAIPSTSGTLSTEDMHCLWGMDQKIRITCGKVLRNLIPLPVYHHGLLISRFSMDKLVDLSMFKPIEISATYDSHTFSSMGYVEVGNRWVKKDSVQEKTDIVRPTKISAESATLLLQDSDELKTRILVVERGPKTLHDVVEKVFRLQKDTSTDVGKLRITMTGIKQGGIPTFNKLIKQVDSLNSGVVSSNNDLAISV